MLHVGEFSLVVNSQDARNHCFSIGFIRFWRSTDVWKPVVSFQEVTILYFSIGFIRFLRVSILEGSAPAANLQDAQDHCFSTGFIRFLDPSGFPEIPSGELENPEGCSSIDFPLVLQAL